MGLVGEKVERSFLMQRLSIFVRIEEDLG